MKWAKEIEAWANGKPIQFKYKNNNTWYDTNNLIFGSTLDDLEFRIKPELICYLDSIDISNSIEYNNYTVCSITFNVKMNETGTKEGFKLFYKGIEVFPNT